MTLRKLTRRRGGRVAAALASAVVLLLLSPASPLRPAYAEGEPAPFNVVRVEQDWKLMLNEPRQSVVAPQFHTFMSPYPHADIAYAQATWNYRELPSFVGGGVQIQAWGPDAPYAQRSLREEPLSLTAETITWTQVLETDGTRLRFKIINGQSPSWGSFGGPSSCVDAPVPVPTLNNYSTEVTRKNSWITFGANRVSLLMITQVRYYAADGRTYTDSTPVVIYELPPSD